MNLLFDEKVVPDQLVRQLQIPARLRSSTPRAVPSHTGSRSHAVEDILSDAEEAAKAIGMTRLADLTGLDKIGIPVFSAACATTDAGLITVFNGKGVTEVEAKVSALMELVERVSASPRAQPKVYGSYEDLVELIGEDVAHPSSFIVHRREIPAGVVPLSWTWACDLARCRPILVPAVAVFHPFYDDSGPLFVNNSSGLAAGATLLEAVLQALYEVVERDAVSLAMASQIATSVPLDSVEDAGCRTMLKRFERSRVRVRLKEATTDLGIPVYLAIGNDREARNSFFLNGGYGCHARREVALTRALSELAQSRATIISGAREDIPSMRSGDGSDYEEILAANRRLFEDTEPIVHFSDLPTFTAPDLWKELEWLVGRIRKANLPGPYVVDLAPAECPFPVVRVLVPGLECWNRDRRRIGQRLIKACRLGRRLGYAADHEP